MERKKNRLANETSPYLLQHAHNPVDWYPWGEEALQKSKKENKPILVSIGYSACHWCHVMERESFEDEATAAIMNEHFVNIKIDREERPDLDHIYMDAVQTLTGSGGWPLNVFLTPECKPFYGGTYFPPRQSFNRPSWKEVLYGVTKTYTENPTDINAQAENLTAHLIQANSFGLGTTDTAITTESMHRIFENIMKTADRAEGGFGRAPKFPQTFTIQYLLEYYHHTGNQSALDQACLSLDKMIYGGIYDQIGGGFARYATDGNWLIPHFEKMLYDNALLVMVLSEAWQLTHKELYKTTIEQTLQYIQREMLSGEFGFYAALDADSEGEEGKFYVWDLEEVKAILGKDAPLFCSFYDVSEEGNWEGKNILHIHIPLDTFSNRNNISPTELDAFLKKSGTLLLHNRNKRPRPSLDDKMLLGWNALMNTALSKAYAAVGNENYKDLAVRNMDFLLKYYGDPDTGNFYHTYKDHMAKYPAFLDDYAYLIQALIHLQEITGNADYLNKARHLTEIVLEHFSDEETGLFFFTHKEQRDVVIRKKEIYDGATPSGNSIMAWNLLYLEIIFDKQEWKERVVKMLKNLAETTVRYPTSFGVWSGLIQKMVIGVAELVVLGPDPGKLLNEILHIFMPHKVLQVSASENNDFPLLNGKSVTGQPVIFLCENYACKFPVTDLNSLMRLLDDPNTFSKSSLQ